MAQVITPPKAQVPIGLITIAGQRYEVQQHPEFVRFFFDTFNRIGGTNGASSEDLSLSQFEDAGIEEAKAQIFSVRDDLAQLPPVVTAAPDTNESGELAELRARVDALQTAVQALQQGLTP